jgi:hypothetical protein
VSRQLELLLVYHECGSFCKVVGTGCQMPIASGHCTAHGESAETGISNKDIYMLTYPKKGKEKTC